MLASGILIFSYFLHRNTLTYRSVFHDNSYKILIVLLLLLIIITPFAYSISASLDRAIQLLKIIIVYFFIVRGCC